MRARKASGGGSRPAKPPPSRYLLSAALDGGRKHLHCYLICPIDEARRERRQVVADMREAFMEAAEPPPVVSTTKLPIGHAVETILRRRAERGDLGEAMAQLDDVQTGRAGKLRIGCFVWADDPDDVALMEMHSRDAASLRWGGGAVT